MRETAKRMRQKRWTNRKNWKKRSKEAAKETTENRGKEKTE